MKNFENLHFSNFFCPRISFLLKLKVVEGRSAMYLFHEQLNFSSQSFYEVAMQLLWSCYEVGNEVTSQPKLPRSCYKNSGFLSLTHFWPMFPFYTPLKTPENQRFPGVFRGCKMATLARNGLIMEQYLKK